MRRFISAMLAGLGLLTGCSKSGVLAPGQFTDEYLAAFRKASPDLKVATVRDLELEVTKTDGGKFTIFLDNA